MLVNEDFMQHTIIAGTPHYCIKLTTTILMEQQQHESTHDT